MRKIILPLLIISVAFLSWCSFDSKKEDSDETFQKKVECSKLVPSVKNEFENWKSTITEGHSLHELFYSKEKNSCLKAYSLIGGITERVKVYVIDDALTWENIFQISRWRGSDYFIFLNEIAKLKWEKEQYDTKKMESEELKKSESTTSNSNVETISTKSSIDFIKESYDYRTLAELLRVAQPGKTMEEAMADPSFPGASPTFRSFMDDEKRRKLFESASSDPEMKTKGIEWAKAKAEEIGKIWVDKNLEKAFRLTEILRQANSEIVLAWTDVFEIWGLLKLSQNGLLKLWISEGSLLEGAVNDILNGRPAAKYSFDFPHRKQKFETDGSLTVISAKGQVLKNLEEVKKIQELYRKIVIAQKKKEPSVDLGNGSVVDAKDFPKLINQISTEMRESEIVESEMESFKGKGFLDVNLTLKLDSTAPVN